MATSPCNNQDNIMSKQINKTVISNLSFLRAKMARMEDGGIFWRPVLWEFCPSWAGCPEGWDFNTFTFYNRREVALARLELAAAKKRHDHAQRAYHRAKAKAQALEAKLGFCPSDFEIGLALA
jgi:hypothetical protein